MTYTARDLLDLRRPEAAVRWRRLRRKRRLRLVDVAQAIGCSRSYLGRIETGMCMPGYAPQRQRMSRVLEALADFYGVTQQ